MSNIITKCPICQSLNYTFFIKTTAMMHHENGEYFDFMKCANCESVFLRNAVHESALIDYYSSSYLPYLGSKAWGKYENFVKQDDEKLNSDRTKLVVNFLKNDKNKSVLDIGCGKGDFLINLHNKTGWRCVGVDIVSADWTTANHKKIELHACDWKNMEFKMKFDCITAWHYLEHDYNPVTTIEKIYKILKPNGILIVEVPMYEGILQKLQKTTWQGWHSPRHISLFSFKSWSYLFDSSNWEIIKHKKYGTLSAFTLWWLGHMEKKHIIWSTNMEKHFWGLVVLKVLSWPFFIFEKLIPFGVQTIIVKKR